MQRFYVSLACAVVCLAFAATAHAGDGNPPGPNNPFAPWTRGDPFTTTSFFRFPTNGQLPDNWISNPTLPSSSIQPGPGSQWLPGPPGTTYEGGVWCIQNDAAGGPGFLDILIPNYHRPDPKIVYVQFKFFGGVPKFDVFDIANPPPTGPLATPWTTLTPTPTPVPGVPGLSQISYSLCFPYNPDVEVVRIMPNGTVPTYIDQLVIDTLCTPTPGGGALLAIGALVAARRRR